VHKRLDFVNMKEGIFNNVDRIAVTVTEYFCFQE